MFIAKNTLGLSRGGCVDSNCVVPSSFELLEGPQRLPLAFQRADMKNLLASHPSGDLASNVKLFLPQDFRHNLHTCTYAFSLSFA